MYTDWDITMAAEKKKIDFRRGNRASQRTEEAMNVIREVLSRGDATFGVLLEKTGLSRRALASNLKRLVKMGELRRWVDEKDRRVRHYSLEDLGWERYRQQKVSQILRHTELTPLEFIMDVIVEYVASALIAASKVTELERHMERKGDKLPKLTKVEEAMFLGSLQGRIYACNNKNENVGLFEALKEFLAMTKLVIARKDINLELLKGLPNIVFTFEFSKEKFIELCQHLQKAGRIGLTEDFIRVCSSLREKDYMEFIKGLDIEKLGSEGERQS
jgi:DNA-binding MarR family transcriptional regulator